MNTDPQLRKEFRRHGLAKVDQQRAIKTAPISERRAAHRTENNHLDGCDVTDKEGDMKPTCRANNWRRQSRKTPQQPEDES